MTASLIQSRNATTATSPITSQTLAYSSSVTQGNLLVAYAGWYTGSLSPGESITDTQGNTWQQAVLEGNTNYNVAILWAVAGATGANTVTIAFPSGSGYTALFIHEFSGVNACDQTATGTASGATSATTGSVSTNYSTELLFGGFNCSNGVTTPGSGYTAAQTNGQLTEWRAVSSAGSYSASASGGSGNWNAVMATFYLASVPLSAYIQVGRLKLGPPLQWYEQLGDPITNLGGAVVPSPRTALRHSVTVPTFAPDGATDTLAARLTLRQQLRSMLNNTVLKLQGYCYLQYSDDTDQNGWYIPDQGQLSDIDTSSGLVAGAWKLDNVNWAMIGHRRTHREARNIWMKNLTSGLNYRDTLRLLYSQDFNGLTPLGLTILPAGAQQATYTLTGQVVPLTQQITGRDGGASYLTTGPVGYSPLPDLSCVAYDRPEASWGLSDVICYDRRGDISAPSTGPASDWVEVYGSDFPWNWITAGQPNDMPVLDNGLVRVRYDASTGSPGFKVDLWTGSAYVEQGKMCVQANGSTDDTFVSAGLHLDNSYTPDRATAVVVLSLSTSPYTREKVFITVSRGQPGVTFELYPAPLGSGTSSDCALYWQVNPSAADVNASAAKIDSQTQTSATIGPAAGNGKTAATAGSGSSAFTTATLGASSFTSSDNEVALLRCSAVATLTGYQTNFAVLQAANAYCKTQGNAALGYSTASNAVGFISQNSAGYLSVDVGFSPTAAQQVLEAENMTLGTNTTAPHTSDASNGQTTYATRSTDANYHVEQTNWPSGQPGVYRVFARCKTNATQASFYAKTDGATTGSTVTLAGAATPTYSWVDLGEVSVPSATTTLEIHAWVSSGTGGVDVDRIEAYLMTERVYPARYTGARDFGQSVLYDSRALGAIVSR